MLFIRRAIKWARRARRAPTGALGHTRIQDQHGGIIGKVQLLTKNLGSDLFSCRQNGECELTRAFAFGTHLTRLRLLGLLCSIQKRRHINACETPNGQNDQ